MMTLQRRAGVSLWRQIAETLEKDIKEQVFEPGQKLPTEAELAERFSVNRHTVRRGIAYLALRERSVLIETRPARGLLGGMLGLPCGDWVEGAARPGPPFAADWRSTGAEVRHTFTHFHLLLAIEAARVPPGFIPPAGRFQPLTPALESSLPTVMRKALRLGLEALA